MMKNNIHKNGNKLYLYALTMLCFLLSSCGKNVNDSSVSDISEAAQQVGDVMASIDESGGSSSGALSFNELQSAKRTFARFGVPEREFSLSQILLPQAQASACSTVNFTLCSSGTRTKNFNSCTVGAATFTGSVVLNFSNSSCSMASNGATVSRTPNFTVTGRRGGVLTVEMTGTYGQRIIRGASSFTFENDGIRRYFDINGQTLFDFTTITTSPVTFTGSFRNGRTLNGGALRITNNSNSSSCTITPTSVTYPSSCNCATSGTWSGTCSDGNSFNLQLTGCGTGSLTIGEESESVTFDRCYST